MKQTPYTPKQFDPSLLLMNDISRKTIENHIKLYEGYIKKYNEINQKITHLSSQEIAESNQVYSYVRSLKTELSFAWGGIINHEIYFSHLGNNKGTASRDLIRQIERDFGSWESYLIDLKSSGMAARGWVWTVWNKHEKRLYNHIGDSQNTYAFWGSEPILALDTYEHAYIGDFGINRSAYIDAFISHILWDKVEDALKVHTKLPLE